MLFKLQLSKLTLLSSLFILIATPAIAFDFGKIISNSVEKAVKNTVDNSVRTVERKVTEQVNLAISSVMPERDIQPKQENNYGGSSEPVVPQKDLSKGVIIFGHDGCPFCRKAYSFMKQNKIRYELMDTRRNDDAYLIYKDKGHRGVPIIYVSGERVAGFSDSMYTELFKRHGLMK